MTKYRINKHEITGKKGTPMYKDQVVDERQFVDGSVDHLVSIGAISAVKADDLPKSGKKGSKEDDKEPKETE
jgi:hypothetical protein